MGDIETLSAELERLYQRQADLRAHEVDLAERGENDPASDEWKLAAVAASGAEADFRSALVRNYSTISRVLREAAEGRVLGWNEWTPNIEKWTDGGYMPVPEGTIIDVQYRDGQYGHWLAAGENMNGKIRDAGPAFWRPDGAENDIVRWRLCSPPPATETTKTEERK